MPEVSVVIASYNCSDTIERCIESLLSQSDQDFEIIICDDASNDNTVELISKYQRLDKRIKLLKNDIQFYSAYSRNRCIKEAKGKYIMIQDADDYSHKDRIKILKWIMKNSESYDFVSSAAAIFDESGIWGKRVCTIVTPKSVDMVSGLCFIHAATMFTRECLINVGMYRVAKETRRGQDYDLFMRLYSKGYKGMNISDELYYIEENRNSYNRRKYRYRIGEAIIRYKGYSAMKLKRRYYFFILKPLLIGLIPGCILHNLRKFIYRN